MTVDPITRPSGPVVGTATRGPVARLRHDLTIVITFVKLGVLNLVQYRSDFALSVVNAVITLATQVAGLSVIFANTAELGGWTPFELLVLVGIHFLISGLIGVVVRPSMEAMMEGIRLGTFDFTLTKPADSQLLASAQVVRPQSLTDVAVGLVVIIVGVVQSGAGLGPVEIGLFLLMLLAGTVIMYSFILLLSTLAFWFVKLDNVLAIFQAVFGQAGRWPVTLFPGPLRLILTFVVPVAFAVTVPAQALTGRLDALTTLGALGLGVAFFVLTRWFWFFALRRYTGASA